MAMMLSPIEKSVLASCAPGQEISLGELQSDLFPLFDPDSVRAACSFLRRRLLLTQSEFAAFERTDLGTRVLAEQRRKEDEQILGGARLRAV
jgi:hypothetical protein